MASTTLLEIPQFTTKRARWSITHLEYFIKSLLQKFRGNYSRMSQTDTDIKHQKVGTCRLWSTLFDIHTLITRFMGPTWGPSGADRTQVGPMLAPWILLSGYAFIADSRPQDRIARKGLLNLRNVKLTCIQTTRAIQIKSLKRKGWYTDCYIVTYVFKAVKITTNVQSK